MTESSMRTPRRQAIWDLTGGRCFYCGCDLIADSDRQPMLGSYADNPERSMEADHKLATKLGGADDLANTVPACGGCNVRKGLKTPDEFRLWLMITDGRPPEPFFGEEHRAPRDWLVVVTPRPRHAPIPTLRERIAIYAGAAPV